MEKIQVLYNVAFSSNTIVRLSDSIQFDNLDEQLNNENLFQTQRNVALNNEYYSYSTLVGNSVVNDLNIKSFLDRPENEKITIEFLSYLRGIYTLDEFRDIFYDNKKLADFFNQYYNKYINYSNQGLNDSQVNEEIDLINESNKLFNSDQKYLKTNSLTNYFLSDDLSNSAMSANQRPVTPDYDLIYFSGYSENYFVRFKINKKSSFLYSENFSEYFKDICDGNLLYTKYNYKNSISTNIKFGNLSELYNVQQQYNSNYGPSKNSIDNIIKLLPQFYLPSLDSSNSNSSPNAPVYTDPTYLEEGIYNTNLLNQSIIFPTLNNGQITQNFTSFNKFKKFTNFDYRRLTPNFNTIQDAKEKYIYSQVLLTGELSEQLLKNNRFNYSILDGTNGWYGHTLDPYWQNPSHGMGMWWTVERADTFVWRAYSNGFRQPLWQRVPTMVIGQIYKIEIKIEGASNNIKGIRTFLGLIPEPYYSPLMIDEELYTVSDYIRGNGTFTIFQQYLGGAPGISIQGEYGWDGGIREIKMFLAGDINFYSDILQNSEFQIGRIYNPITTNIYRINLQRVNTITLNQTVKAILQYESFSPSIVGPDDGFHAFSFVNPTNNDPYSLSKEVIFVPSQQNGFVDLYVYKNWPVRYPIVFSLRDFDNPNIVIEYLIVYLEEFYDISTNTISEQIDLDEFNRCNTLYNGFVKQNYNDNYLERYRPDTIPLIFQNNSLGFYFQQIFTDQTEIIVNQKLLNVVNDSQLTLFSISNALGIPQSSIFNIYVNDSYYYENQQASSDSDITIVIEGDSEEYYFEQNGYKFSIYSARNFQNQLNEFGIPSQENEQLITDRNFFQYFTQEDTFKILERIEFTTNISKLKFKTKAIQVSDSYFAESEKLFREKNFQGFRTNMWNAIRVLVFGIQYLKFGQITDRKEANSYLSDVQQRFDNLNEVRNYFTPKIRILKDDLNSL